jgi:penicillin-binding protein 2
VQKLTERALAGKLAAAAVVIDVNTGRVLALASRPGFDPNMMSSGPSADAEARLSTNRLRPFVDKALSETYNPGSTFKVISALAALEEGLITPEDRTKCYGYVQIGRRRFRCTKSHGQIGLVSAIAQSCNFYFYELGARPGMMNRLAKFATDFGLGAPSGLGLNSDQPGFVPTEEWHRAQQANDPKNEGFVVGHALNTSIGEGATRTTVTQMALLYAALATGGKLWLPQIVERIESPAGKLIEEFPPRSRRDIPVSKESLSILKRALLGVVNDPKGTAFKARSKKVLVAGKTGTAQVQRTARRKGDDPPLPYEQIDHAWFAGFAPADRPRIAFAVIVEHGGHGGDVAAPVAMELVEAYLDLPAPPPAPSAAATNAPAADVVQKARLAAESR